MLFNSTVEKDVRFCHTEASFSNSFVARLLIIPQVFYCCNMMWHWTYTKGWKAEFTTKLATLMAGLEYTEPTYTSVVDQIRTAVQANCSVILVLLLV